MVKLQMEEKAFYRQLVQRYMENKATDDELEVFFHLLEQGRLDEYITAYMEQSPANTEKGPAVIRRIPRKLWLAAAVMGAVLLAGGGIYLARLNTAPVQQQLGVNPATVQQRDIRPGGDNAVLTLADGSTITLDSAGTGSLSVQGSTTVLKQAGGRLAYRANGTATPQMVQYNMLTTPRGGKYQVILPDGSSVLLNAASSLRFPTAFPGREREVELNGEAYFDVSKNAAQPFRVKLLSQDSAAREKAVEVLGTSFNIMAYQDEPFIRTTLVTGAVRVSGNGKAAMLLPGQQAVMDKASAAGIKVENANIEEAIAWKNNEFYFSNTNIYNIMRQISRWYNVDVSYEDSLHVLLNGNIRKNVNASQVFKMLELTGEVQFRITGRQVIVSSRHSGR